MSDSVLLPVPTTSPPHVTERSYSTAIRCAGHEVAAAERGSASGGRRRSEVAVDHRADVDQLARRSRGRRPPPRRRPATPATRCGTAAARTAAARRRSPRRPGTRRAPSRCRPTGPRTARSNPAWRSWPRMNSLMTRRATSVSIASSSGSSNSGPAPPATAAGRVRSPVRAGRARRPLALARTRSDAAAAARAPRPVPPRRRRRRSVGVRPARSATIRDSSRTCELRAARRAAAAARSARAGCRRGAIVDRVQPLVVERRAEDRRPVRPDDLGAAPERDRLVDADAVAEDHERGRQLGVGAHQRPPRGRGAEADLVGRGEVAARRRRHVDQDLGAVERQESAGTPRCQKSSQTPIPIPTPSRDGTARSRSPAAKKRRSSNSP